MDKVIENLRCSFCNQYLIHGPLLETLSGCIICGRCSTASSSARRTRFLEKLVQEFSFPCKNNKHGCSHSLTFGMTEDHENNCKYECMPCPFLKNERCTRVSTFEELNYHILHNHGRLIKKDFQFSINLLTDKKDEYVVLFQKELYFMKYDYSSLTLKYSIAQFTQVADEKKSKIQISNALDEDRTITMKGNACVSYRSLLKSANWFIINLAPFIETLFDSKLINCNVIPVPSETNSKILTDVSTLNSKCKWDGCKTVPKIKDKETHEKSCNNRLYKCFVPHCECFFTKTSGAPHLKSHGLVYWKQGTAAILNFNQTGIALRIATFMNHEYFGICYGKTVKKEVSLNLKLVSTSSNKEKCLVRFSHTHCSDRSKAFYTSINRELAVPETNLPPCYIGDNNLHLNINLITD